MAHKNIHLIPVLASIILIPHLLFWWLAPSEVSSYLFVYAAGTILTATIPAVCFLAYWKTDIRRTAGLLLTGCILDAAAVTLATLLFGMNASIRTTIFSFLIMALVDLIILIPLFSGAVTLQVQGSRPLENQFGSTGELPSSAHQQQPENDIRNADISNQVTPIRRANISVPLPVKNR